MQLLKKAAFNILKPYFIYTSETPEKEVGFTMVESRASAALYNKLYLGLTDKTNVRRQITFNRLKTVKQKTAEWGLSIINADSLPNNCDDYLTVPDFVELTIKLPIDIETYQKALPNAARYDLRKIKRAGFTCVVSTDFDWVSTFHKRYYEPSMRLRHGEEAYVISERELQILMRNETFEFLNIYDGEICVGSVMAQQKNSKYYFFKVGWLNGDSSLFDKGTVAAMYWYSIKRAFELHCSELVLGGTPTYLESGVLKYKSKWLATFLTKYYGLNKLLLNPDNLHCYEFLQRFSLMALNQNNSFIVLSSKTKAELAITGIILSDVTAWYILRKTKAKYPDEKLAELPMALRYWYQIS